MPKKPINPASTSKPVEITFKALAVPQSGSVVVLTDEKAEMSGAARAIDSSGLLKRAFKVAKFTGKARSSVDIIAPAGSDLDRIVAVGIGERDKMEEFHWLRLGGAIAGKAGSEAITLIASAAPELSAQEVAWLAEGILLRAYRFDRYKTARKDDDGPSKDLAQVTIMVEDPAPARKLFKRAKAVSGGVALARDVVNEPANILGPVEFANAAEKLKDLGVDVEILGEKQIAKLKMGAFLGVSQGSSRPPRIAIMRWNGGKSKETPVAFIGKGVVFDTGGISIKPSAGMEDMKGDMGGAAAVIGLMHAVAARKAKANVIGMIGLVENMPDGNAQRPGDIVTSMSGKTIEVLNTDAEGRLILADLLTLCQKRFKPEFIIDLATLTGAIVVALGNHHAGLFSNDDELAERLGEAGVHTGERVWRMPLAEEYDKMIDSKNADVKNIGGKWAGAVTAAQFLKRFVGDVKWAHLDIAGTAMGSPLSDVNQSWGSGFGVRLLDRLIADYYEDPAPKTDS